MRYKLADDAKPQVWLLLAATVLTIVLWFIPYAEYLVYPVRLFVTFIHESSHALVAVLTGGSVQSLTISSDGSGVVYSMGSSWIGQLLTSSAGYLGATAFGVILLFLIRKNFSPNKLLTALGIFVGIMTVVFTVISPVFHIFSLQAALSSIFFTILAGIFLTAGLVVLGIYSNQKVANFAVAFLAVQCLLNSLSDLKTVFFMSAPMVGSDMQTDAGNMYAATGVPAFMWVIGWIGLSLLMISIGLRLYAVNKNRAADTVFQD